jgi:hypothetical protein
MSAPAAAEHWAPGGPWLLAIVQATCRAQALHGRHLVLLHYLGQGPWCCFFGGTVPGCPPSQRRPGVKPCPMTNTN